MRFTRKNVNRIFKVTIVGIIIVAFALLFMANPGQAQVSTVDDFEDGDLSEYTSATNFAADNSDSREGSWSLKATDSQSIHNDSALNDVPEPGDRFSTWIFFGNSTDAGTNGIVTSWAVQGSCSGSNSRLEGYNLFVDWDDPRFLLQLCDSGGTVTTLASDNSFSALSLGKWYNLTVHWQSDNTFNVTLRDGSTNLTSVETTDTTYTSGAIGFGETSGSGTLIGRWDHMRIHGTSSEGGGGGTSVDLQDRSGNNVHLSEQGSLTENSALHDTWGIGIEGFSDTDYAFNDTPNKRNFNEDFSFTISYNFSEDFARQDAFAITNAETGDSAILLLLEDGTGGNNEVRANLVWDACDGTAGGPGGEFIPEGVHQLTVTIENASGGANVEFYVDGESKSQQDGVSTNPCPGKWDDEFFLGRGATTGNPLENTLYDFRFYNKDLTDSQVSDIYNNAPDEEGSEIMLYTFGDSVEVSPFKDWGSLGNDLEEIGSLTNVSSGSKWGKGLDGFTTSDYAKNDSLSNYNPQLDSTFFFAGDLLESEVGASPHAVSAGGFSDTNGDFRWFQVLFSEGGDNSDGNLEYQLIWDDCSGTSESISKDNAIPEGNFTFGWKYVEDGSEVVVTTYVNGNVERDSLSFSTKPCTDASQMPNNQFLIGCDFDVESSCSSGDNYNGEIHDFRYFGKALTNAQYSDLNNNHNGTTEEGSELVFYSFGDSVSDTSPGAGVTFFSRDASINGYTDITAIDVQTTTGSSSVWARDRGITDSGTETGNRILKWDLSLGELQNREICTDSGDWDGSGKSTVSFGITVTSDGFPAVPCDATDVSGHWVHMLKRDGAFDKNEFTVINTDEKVGSMPMDALSGNKVVLDCGDAPQAEEEICQWDFVNVDFGSTSFNANDVDISRSGNGWVSAIGDSGIGVWNNVGGVKVVPVKGATGTDIEIHEKRLFTYSDSTNKIQRWDINKGSDIVLNESVTFDASLGGTNRFDLSPDGKILGALTSTEVQVWDARKGENLEKLGVGNLSVDNPNGIAIHPTNDFLFVSNDTTITRYDISAISFDQGSFTEDDTTGAGEDADTGDTVPEGEEGTSPFDAQRIQGMSQNQTDSLMAVIAVLLFAVFGWGISGNTHVTVISAGLGFILANIIGWVPVWFTILMVMILAGVVVAFKAVELAPAMMANTGGNNGGTSRNDSGNNSGNNSGKKSSRRSSGKSSSKGGRGASPVKDSSGKIIGGKRD